MAGDTNPQGKTACPGSAGRRRPLCCRLATVIRHLPPGPVKSLAYGNGLRLERQHDLDYRRAAQAVGGVQSLAYAYGAAGRLAAATDGTDPANNETYGYDALGRLLSAQGRYGSLAYTYDAVGNRTADWRDGAETRYTYDPASQRLLSLSGAKTDSLAYDINGNATLAGGREFAYAPDQRLSAARQGGADTARHAYDPFGRRVGKSTAANWTAWTAWVGYDYDLQGRLLAESEAPATYAWLDGEPLARVDYDPYDWYADPATWGILYYHNTPSGTPHTATGQDGQVAWRANAEPFGRMSPEGPAVQNLRFPGQWFDAEDGLHYNMARYYDPLLGRYLQADPIGLAGGANLYGYVGGDPVNFVDPLGLCVEDLCIGEGVTAITWCMTNPACATGAAGIIAWGVNNVLPTKATPFGDSGITPPLTQDGDNAIIPKKGKGCPPKSGNQDPCKGLREQLKDHERKLAKYMDDPMSMDNKGFLTGAIERGNTDLFWKIRANRIKELKSQIANFMQQLQECENSYGSRN